MATVAVALALTGGGVAYASNLIVRSSDIVNGAVTAPKLAGGAVKARKIANGAVTGRKIADGAVGDGKIANGAVNGSKIANGAVNSGKIANGAVTPAKLSFVPVRGIETVTVNDTAGPGTGDYYSSRFLTVECPAGKKVLGGGYYLGTSSHLATVHKSGPTAAGTGWDVWVYNGGAYSLSFSGYAVCASF